MSDFGAGTSKYSLSSFGRGAFLLIEGARFLRRERQLWALASIPVLFALVAVAIASAIFSLSVTPIHDAWVSLLPSIEVGEWWSWSWLGPAKVVVWLLGWLAVIATFALMLVGALLTANLAAAPFLDLLSQRVETIETGIAHAASEAADRSVVGDALRSFASEFQRLIFLAGLWIVLSALGFVIPGGQLVTTPLLVGLTILFLPLDYAGFALDRGGLSFKSRRAWLIENRSLMLGFGSVAFIACLVPGLNLLILPAQVTAGTLLVSRIRPNA